MCLKIVRYEQKLHTGEECFSFLARSVGKTVRVWL